MKHLLLPLLFLSLLAGCRNAQLPEQYTESTDSVCIYPDYQDVTVPCNIAPLTFHIDTEAEDYRCRLSDGKRSFVYAGRDICPEESEWRTLKGTIEAEVYILRAGAWTRLQPFHIYISTEEIDPYLTYRLIAPSYVTYEDLTLCQRNLTNYDEDILYGNMSNSTERSGQCINCHATQNYNPECFQFHIRQGHAGTLIAWDGEVKHVNLKTGKTTGAGTYPAWHPTEKLIAYSTNLTSQAFHTRSNAKVEVQDSYSDLMLYDLERNEVLPLERDTNDLDCFPHWSPDGKWLYYCSARYERQDTTGTVTREYDLMQNYQNVRYNLYRRSFDLATRSFGPRELVHDAAADSMSATLPRLSPDGRWLMFTRARYGVFHIWHPDADLYLNDLQTRETRPMNEVNSPQTESYHSWSSNSRWVVFSSRRTDGNFTRPFFAYVDKEGRCTKPFELPSRQPEYHRQLLRSYNVPEFMHGPVTYRPQRLARIIRQPALQAQ